MAHGMAELRRGQLRRAREALVAPSLVFTVNTGDSDSDTGEEEDHVVIDSDDE